jgi:hypothetical protein
VGLEEVLDGFAELGIDVAILTWCSGRYGLKERYEVVLTDEAHGLLATMTGDSLGDTLARAVDAANYTLQTAAPVAVTQDG